MSPYFSPDGQILPEPDAVIPPPVVDEEPEVTE